MEMPKKSGIIFIITGVVLILAALLLFLYNVWEDYQADQQAELLMSDIQSVLENETDTTTKPETEITDHLSANMPVSIINGNEYIGYITIPELELELPVMSEWSYARLKIAPCRQFGSTRTDDLVIAAHNYKSHFGKLSTLEAGAEIIFTDMDGIENRYVLANAPETLAPDNVEAVQNSGHALVLYTCTPGGASRVVAFCDRKIEMEGEEHE